MRGLSKSASASGSLRVLAALLSYPGKAMRSDLPEMREILRSEGVLSVARQVELEALIDTLAKSDPLESEANYVQLFDSSRATSLHLFEHVHGDSRDRGPAMIDLAQAYEKAGLYLEPGELPDYLPAVLEFVSTQPQREARAFLGEITHILNSLFSALHQRAGSYASVMAALLELAGEKVQMVKPAVELPLDEAWAEPPAFDGCSIKGQAKPGEVQPIHFVRKNVNTGAVT